MTALSVTEISDLLHYHSSQNFARAFKRFTNTSPSSYRKSDEWKLLPLQLPLFIKNHCFSYPEIVNLPDLYIDGVQARMEEIVALSTDNSNVKKFFYEAIKSFTLDGITNFHVAGIVPIPSEINVGRNNEVTVYLYAGLLTDSSSAYVVHIPAGNYVKWNFSCSFDDYYVCSKVASVFLLQNVVADRRAGYDYIHFNASSMTDGVLSVSGSLYIPVTG